MDYWRRKCVFPVFLTPCVGGLTFIAFICLVIPVFPTTFVFNEFNETNITLEANATLIRSQSVLALTTQTRIMLGRAFYSIPVQMKSNETLSSFSTTFVFSIVPPRSEPGGHGMAFIVTPYTTLMSSLQSQYLGLLNNTSNGQSYNHLFAVEFDTIQSVEFNDPDGNHVGVDINNLDSVHAETAGYWTEDDFQGLNLKSGRNIQAWIDYDSCQSRFNVSVMPAGLQRPQRPLISLKIDLRSVLQEKMFVGFSAATSHNLVEDHYVLAWSFTTEGTAAPLDISLLPSFVIANKSSKRPSVGFIAGVTMAALVVFSLAFAAVFLKREKYREKIEEWEQDFWPHRFAYKELRIATSGFKNENVLGQGGCGKVYKGALPGSGKEIAVKCITREFTEGMKGFVAEISTMGRMQHRNLVQLLGWCRKQKQLFIVYDHMPNGSLDKLIFGKPTTALPWARRYAMRRGCCICTSYGRRGSSTETLNRATCCWIRSSMGGWETSASPGCMSTAITRRRLALWERWGT